MVDVRYRGYSFFEYRGAGRKFFVDPAFSVYRRGEWIPAADVERCDYVLLTHGDFEHFSDAPDVMDGSDAVLVASSQLCRAVFDRSNAARERFMVMRDSEAVTGPGFRIAAFELEHVGYGTLWRRFLSQPSDIPRLLSTQADALPTAPFQAFSLCFGDPGSELRILHLNEGLNTGTLWEDIEELASHERPDILVCAADRDFTREVARGVEILDPKEVLLHHPHEPIYRRLGLRSLSMERFVDAIHRRSPDVKVTPMSLGSSWSDQAPTKTVPASAGAG